jgi:tyrosyl-tRNA synthetase
MVSLSADLEFRGLIQQVTDSALVDLLDQGGLVAYAGFDPTADSLHVGHLLPVLVLRRLQLAGHRPIAVAGGATGMIGDPGGKQTERPLLEPEELRANVKAIRAQLEGLLDFHESGAQLLDNRDWLAEIRLVEFLREIGKHFTVNQMIGKESVKARLERPEHGISFTEFSYMLLQAYDFLHLFDHYGCRVQLGASDQWGNITMGIDLVRKLRSSEVWGLTTPLVTRADGSKFGKSESGTVWLDPRRTSPFQLYQFFLRSEDAVVGTYLRFFTFLDHDSIRTLDEATLSSPERRVAQQRLAAEVCELVHGRSERERVERATAALYGGGIGRLDEPTLLEACAEAPTTTLRRSVLEDGGLSVVDILASTGLARSKSHARTTIAQGGASVNDGKIRDVDARLTVNDLLFGRYVILRRGRRDYHLLRFE